MLSKCGKGTDAWKNPGAECTHVFCIKLLHFDTNVQKIDQEVDYPPELTAPNYQDASATSTTKYNLSSIIVHEENQISSGHYVCYVNRSERRFHTSDTIVKRSVPVSSISPDCVHAFLQKSATKKDAMSGEGSENNMLTKEAAAGSTKNK